MEIQQLFFPVHPAFQEQPDSTTAISSPLPTLNLLPHSLPPSFPLPAPLSTFSLSSAEPLTRSSHLLAPLSWTLACWSTPSWPADLWQVLGGVSALQLATTAFLATKGLMSLASWSLGWNAAGWFDPEWGNEGFTPRCGGNEQCIYVLLPQASPTATRITTGDTPIHQTRAGLREVLPFPNTVGYTFPLSSRCLTSLSPGGDASWTLTDLMPNP